LLAGVVAPLVHQLASHDGVSHGGPYGAWQHAPTLSSAARRRGGSASFVRQRLALTDGQEQERAPSAEGTRMAGEWIEIRGLVLRADGQAVIVTRGPAVVMPIALAVRALERPGSALWLAGLTWRTPNGLPSLRRLRLIVDGAGSWDAARAAFRRLWRATERGRSIRLATRGNG
jgi:hypothetical protein